MTSDDLDDSEPAHVEPSLFAKAFSLVGAFIAVSAVAALVTFVLVTANPHWGRFTYGIFALAWGVCARLFEASVHQGIRRSLAAGTHLTTEQRKILGEQRAMLRVTRWFVRAELAGSAVLLAVEFLAR